MPDILNIIFNILTSGLPCCLLAIGVFLTFRLLDFADMTAEGSFLLGASLCAASIYNGMNPFLATFLGMLVGIICGIITGVLNRVLKIPKLLSGIITLTASMSIAMMIMGITRPEQIFASQIPLSLASGHQTIYSIFYPGNEWNKVIEALVMVVVVIIAMVVIYYFFGTEYGMAIRATGMNEVMARSQGINTSVSTIACIAISNGLIALAGALYAQDALSVSTVSATGYLVIGLASILIGEAIFGKRSFKNWLISVALGAIVYFTIITIAIRLGFPTELKNLLYAVLITIALCIPLIKKGIQDIGKNIGRKKEVC